MATTSDALGRSRSARFAFQRMFASWIGSMSTRSRGQSPYRGCSCRSLCVDPTMGSNWSPGFTALRQPLSSGCPRSRSWCGMSRPRTRSRGGEHRPQAAEPVRGGPSGKGDAQSRTHAERCRRRARLVEQSCRGPGEAPRAPGSRAGDGRRRSDPLSAVDQLRAIGRAAPDLLDAVIAFLDDGNAWAAERLTREPGWVLDSAIRDGGVKTFACYLDTVGQYENLRAKAGQEGEEQIAEAEKFHKQIAPHAYGPHRFDSLRRTSIRHARPAR
jgi:hypothetical protein